VPSGYTSVASTTPGCTVSGQTVSCVGGELNVSQSVAISITATAPTVLGCLTNTASVVSNESDPNAANNSSEFETCIGTPFAAIAIVKHASVAPLADQALAELGDVISYTYKVTNTGNESLRAVTVDDPTLGAVTCPEATLSPGASERCSALATHTVDSSDVAQGDVTDTASASGTASSGSVTSAPSTAVVKTGGPVPQATPVGTPPPAPPPGTSTVTLTTTSVTPTNPVKLANPVTPKSAPPSASTTTVAPEPTPESVDVGVTG